MIIILASLDFRRLALFEVYHVERKQEEYIAEMS